MIQSLRQAYVINEVKTMIQKECKSIMSIPFEIPGNNYDYVVNMWNKYKKTKRLVIPHNTIRCAFEVHLTHPHHILLYYSAGNENCLLLCRFNGRYYNVILSACDMNLNISQGDILVTWGDV